MKIKGQEQIIVNADGLSIEEKQRVSEALAKIKNKSSTPKVTNLRELKWFYADSQIAWSYGDQAWFGRPATHTPQQVLEMAPTTEQAVFLADMLIITDSAGNIIYDSTLDQLIKKRANPDKGGALPDIGVSVKLDKNGMAVMVEKRKVRKDFDPGKEYSVDVEDCTAEEKKEVQQAFFDAGFPWKLGGKEYRCLDAAQYSNTLVGRGVTAHLMYGCSTERCNMTAKEFLELVYEQGHVHSESMTLYAEDAKTHSKPWELWQVKVRSLDWSDWNDCVVSPSWEPSLEYRRKPKTHIVNGVEVPDLRVTLKSGDSFFLADPTAPKLTSLYRFDGDIKDEIWVERGLCYEPTEEGKQAAILHTKAMLNMVQ